MRRINPYTYPPWLRQTRAVCVQFTLPITIVQGIRTIFLPTTFDVILLAIFIVLTCALKLDWF
ncbi:hypothetical protein [Litchfieldia salsa]|uniref:hypothetical protein n=1 Tax=Litchfieldia salsa TaxID=930152 RepID=UPI000B86DEFD|nr:hypothetical protein [Litchfieldia salsa]